MSVSERSFPKKDPRSGGTIYIWYLGSHKTAHLVAREFRHEDIFQLLMERSPAQLKLSIACELGDDATLQSLLTKNPELARSLSAAECSRLVSAAQNNNTQAVRLMLRAGWPVDALGEMGETALHFAAWHGNTEVMKELLERHPPIDANDARFTNTPLQWALRGSNHSWERHKGDYATAVEMLLQAGAKPPDSIENLEASEAARAALRRIAG